MSSRTNKSSKSHAKGKSKKQDSTSQLKRQKEGSSKSLSSKGKRSAEGLKPVAKIPSSREDSSSNWKALLQKQGKSLPSVPSSLTRAISSQKSMDGSTDVKRFRNSSGSDSRSVSTDRSCSLSQSRCPSQLSMTSETASSVGTDHFDNESEAGGSAFQKDSSQKVKQEFRALGLSEPKESVRQPRGMERGQKFPTRRVIVKKPPPEGLNEFGYFDYSHYGVLRTPITPAHAEFMLDSGIIAMDCEMVGVGPMKESALARVSIVNEYGYCLYDRFVKPKLEVTDYRTQFSGIRENDLKNAVPFQIVSKDVSDILKAHILVGHSLKSDLAVLYLNHPKPRIRDTAFFFRKILFSKTPKLKMLAKKLLGVDIQQGEHSSITDAQATMALYQLYKKEWEISVRQSNRGIDVLRLTLDEFRQMQINGTATLPPPQIPFYTEPHQVTNRDWYDDHDVFPPYCSQDFIGYSEVYSSDSAGASPSESPPICVDSVTYSVGVGNTFGCHQEMADIGQPYQQNAMPGNLMFMPIPNNHCPPPMPPQHPPPPFYCNGPMNGMIVPPMHYHQQPVLYPPPPPQYMPGPPMMIPLPVYHPINYIPLEYNHNM